MLEQTTQSPWTPLPTGLTTFSEQTIEIDAAGRPLRLMVVDDDFDDQHAAMGELVGVGLGNHVEYVSSGKEAIRSLREGTELPDIVLLETYLHDIHGRDVLRWIKSRHPEIDVIALSNFASAAFVQKLYQDGLSCFMRKPFTLQGLLLALGVLPAGKYGITLTRCVG